MVWERLRQRRLDAVKAKWLALVQELGAGVAYADACSHVRALTMRSRKPKKRNAWLITWESSRDDYLKDLQRPRVVAILKPQLDRNAIRKLLPILFTTESQLTFGEKIGYSFTKRSPGWVREDLQSIYCGGNPWLHARLVSDLYVQTYGNTVYRQTLHWTENPRYQLDPDTHRPAEVFPARQDSEDAHFDVLFYGKSFLDKSDKA